MFAYSISIYLATQVN